MKQPIRIWHISMLAGEGHKALIRAIHGEETEARIEAHNWRVQLTWRHVSPNCKPFTPSAVPAAPADLSRVPAVEHGGSALKEARA